MPTFTVQAPDGRSYRVNAPKGATQAQVIAYVQKQHAAPKPRSSLQTAGDFLGDVVDNITPNWGDEIAGAGAKFGSMVGINDLDPKTAFADGQRTFKNNQKQYDKEHPKLAWGSTIGGSIAGLAVPIGQLSKGKAAANAAARAAGEIIPRASRLVRSAKAAAVGAGYGAFAGAGEGDTLAERGSHAVTGAALGAATGTTIPHLGDAAGKAGRFVRANVPGVDPLILAASNAGRRAMRLPVAPPSARPTAHADRMLADRMEQGNILTGPGQHGAPASPTAIADEVAHRARMGVPAMPADTTEAMRSVTSWASRGAGPGQTAVREALARRKAGEGDRIRQHVTETLGPVGDTIATVENNLAASKAAAAPLYRAAYALPTEITPQMAQIMETPAFRDAVPQAVTNIRNSMGNPHTMGFIPQPDGSFIQPANGVLTTEGFDQVVRAMREGARQAGDTNPITGAVTHNTNSVHMNARTHDLQNELTAQNPPLQQAITGYADEAAHRRAMETGSDVGKLTANEVNANARAIPEDAHPSFAAGARNALADQASEYGAKFPNGDTARAVSKSLGDPRKVEALTAMDSRGRTGPSGIPALQQRLEAEHQGNIVSKEVLQGSKTGDKSALDAQVDGEAAPQLSSFSLPGVARAAINFVAEKAATPYRNQVKERIAQVVTETNPDTVRELMAEIAARAQTDRAFGELMDKAGLLAAGSYGENVKHDGE